MASRGDWPSVSPRTRAVGGQEGGNGQVHRLRLARQRRPGWMAAGVGLLALAVLTNVYLFQTSTGRVPVLRVARDVPIGQQITRADLDTAMIALGPGIQTIPVRQLSEVTGRRAAVDLRSGTLLSASELTTQLTPGPGQALVTVAVKHGQLPPGGLAPGAQVRVVSTPGAGGQDGAAQADAGAGGQRDVAATVDEVGGPDADGSMTVSLLVADTDSGVVARQASTGRIALVVTARGGR